MSDPLDSGLEKFRMNTGQAALDFTVKHIIMHPTPSGKAWTHSG